ncbi:hypothetical protein [Burkholderia glumae]|nr:hypothetical protein [Burkholderia glumae]
MQILIAAIFALVILLIVVAAVRGNVRSASPAELEEFMEENRDRRHRRRR